MRSIGHLRDGTPIGAWLLKAHPDVWDIIGFIDAGGQIDSWSLTDSYRVELMAPGDPCVLWITGAEGADPTPGLWAIGEITTEPYEATSEDDGFWPSDEERTKRTLHIGVDLQVLPEPIARGVLADDPRFADAEIFRAPRMGSPLALTPAMYDALETHLDENDLWPDEHEAEAILAEAEEVAAAHLLDLGWALDERDEPPYLTASREDRELEVLVAPTSVGTEFVLGVGEFDELIEELDEDGLLLVVVVFPDDEDDLPTIAQVTEGWRPDPARYDRRTQIHQA